MKLKSIVLVVLCLSIALSASGQSAPDYEVEKFFEHYKSGKIKEAICGLYASSKWMSKKSDALTNLISKLSTTRQLLGEYYGKDLIVSKNLLNRFISYSYFVRHDRQPLRMVFQFYRPQEKWIAFGFYYDEDIDEDLKEASKLYNLSAKESKKVMFE